MTNNIVKNYKVDESKFSITISGNQFNTNSYESNIVSTEHLKNFMQVKELRENYIVYDKEEAQTLKEYAEAQGLRKRDLYRVIKGIEEALMEIENYLISEASIYLDLNTIIIKDDCIKFLIILNSNCHFSFELSKLLVRMLRHVDVSDADTLTIAYMLFVKSSKDNYSIEDLVEIVEKYQ